MLYDGCLSSSWRTCEMFKQNIHNICTVIENIQCDVTGYALGSIFKCFKWIYYLTLLFHNFLLLNGLRKYSTIHRPMIIVHTGYRYIFIHFHLMCPSIIQTTQSGTMPRYSGPIPLFSMLLHYVPLYYRDTLALLSITVSILWWNQGPSDNTLLLFDAFVDSAIHRECWLLIFPFLMC